jgi:hypothetical protein
MSWNNSQVIAAYAAVWDDRRANHMEANVNITCPNCDQPTLSYDFSTIIDCTCWCRTCRSGFKQNRGAKVPTDDAGAGI